MGTDIGGDVAKAQKMLLRKLLAQPQEEL